eukprot:RCo025295
MTPLLHLLHHHRLDIHELHQPVAPALAAQPALLSSAKGQRGVGLHVVIHKHQSGLDLLVGDPHGAAQVLREHRSAQPKRGIIGNMHRLGLVADLNHGGHRTEDLLFVSGHALLDVGDDGEGVKSRPLGALGDGATQGHLGTHLHALYDLLVHLRPGSHTHHGPHLGLWVQGVAHLDRGHLRREQCEKLVVHSLRDDEPLGSDAALTAVQGATCGAHLRRVVQLGVLEDEVGIAAAQLQHGLLQELPRDLTDVPPYGRASRDRHGSDQRVVQHLVDLGARNGHVLEHPRGKPSVQENLLDGCGAPQHVGGVLEDHCVPRGQPTRGLPENLPEREVPRHNDQDAPHRAEGDVAGVHPGGHMLWGQELLPILRVVLADQGTLLHLAQALADGLAHLSGHQLGVLGGALPQQP